jgi:uncharacterized protein YjbI with pentapeptide repeats
LTRHREAKFNNASVDIDASLPPLDFNNAEIQGADFTDAVLSRADFSKATAGLSQFGRFSVIISTFIVSIFSAFPAAIVTTFSIYFFKAARQKLPFSILLLIGLYSFLFTAIIRTVLIRFNLSDLSFFFVCVGTALILIVLVGAGIAITENDFEGDLGSILGTTLPLLGLLILNLFLITRGIELGIDQFLANNFPSLKTIIPNLGESTRDNWVTAIFGALIGAPFGCWFAQSAITGDKKFSWLWKRYMRLATSGGTLFARAELTDANFTSATLKGANFKDAHIGKICWKGARSLEHALFGNCYLKDSEIRRLIVGQRIKGKNFDGLNLEGINLEGSDLAYASFIGTNLSLAKLCGANLTEANLKQARLAGADLTKSILTGACIEDWTIDDTTVLEEVVCKYIHLEKLPGSMSGRRREPPHPKEFQPGDFKKFYGRDGATVQFIIRQDDDRRAVDIALREILQKNPAIKLDDSIGIKTIGNDVLITIQVPQHLDRDLIEQEFRQVYEQAEQQIPSNSNAENYSDLPPLEFVLNVLKELKEIMSNPPANRVTNFDMRDSNISNVADTVHGNQNSTQNIYTQEQRKTLAEAATEIQSLLKQLEQTNPSATEVEKIAYVNGKASPSLKQRVVGALQAGGEAAIDEILENNPYVSVVKAVVKAWIKPG